MPGGTWQETRKSHMPQEKNSGDSSLSLQTKNQTTSRPSIKANQAFKKNQGSIETIVSRSTEWNHCQAVLPNAAFDSWEVDGGKLWANWCSRITAGLCSWRKCMQNLPCAYNNYGQDKGPDLFTRYRTWQLQHFISSKHQTLQSGEANPATQAFWAKAAQDKRSKETCGDPKKDWICWQSRWFWPFVQGRYKIWPSWHVYDLRESTSCFRLLSLSNTGQAEVSAVQHGGCYFWRPAARILNILRQRAWHWPCESSTSFLNRSDSVILHWTGPSTIHSKGS